MMQIYSSRVARPWRAVAGVFLSLALVSLSGCGNAPVSTTTTPSAPIVVTPPVTYTVYAVGSSSAGATLQAMLWKDGVGQPLSSNLSEAYQVAVAGNDIYAVGYQQLSTAYVPTIWKNGVAQSLPIPPSATRAIAYAVQVVGADVYVAGQLGIRPAGAVLWKNGVLTSLYSGVGSGLIEAYGLAVNGSDVYVVGGQQTALGLSTVTVAAIWKNGVTSVLPNTGVSSETWGVAIQGSDVYVTGAVSAATDQSAPSAVYWKNGQVTSLSQNGGYSYGIAFSGADVYLSGYTGNPGPTTACVWKNGVVQAYSSASVSSYVNAIAFGGSSLYAVGKTAQGATFWKDGVATYLTPGTTNAAAFGIAVIQN